MAKLRYIDIIDSASGKLCKHGKTILCYRADTGAKYTSRICNPFSGEPTAAQIAVRTKFSTAIKAANTALNDPTEKATWEAKFKAQTKYKTLHGYVVAQKWSEGGSGH